MGPAQSSFAGKKPLRSERFGRYRLRQLVKTDQIGKTYLATTGLRSRPVTVKIVAVGEMASNQPLIDAFLADLRILKHYPIRYIPRLLAVGQKDEYIYTATEHIDGVRLDRYLRYHDHLQLHAAMFVFREIVSGTACLHKANMVHGNLGPGNVLLTRDRQVKITNVGYARWEQSVLAASPDSMAAALSPHWPPEKCRGRRLDPASDVYSLGAIGFQVFVDRPPFSASDATGLYHCILNRKLPGLAQLRQGIPQPLCALIDQCLQKDRSARPKSAVHVLQALDETVKIAPTELPSIPEGVLGITRRPSQPQRKPAELPGGADQRQSRDTPKRPRFRRNLVVAALVPILLGAGLMIAILVQPGQPSAPEEASRNAIVHAQPAPTRVLMAEVKKGPTAAHGESASVTGSSAPREAIIGGPALKATAPPPAPQAPTAAASPIPPPTTLGPSKTPAATQTRPVLVRRHQTKELGSAYWQAGRWINFRMVMVGRQLAVYTSKGRSKLVKVRDVELPNWVPLTGPIELQACQGPGSKDAKFDKVMIWEAKVGDLKTLRRHRTGRKKLYSTTFGGDVLPRGLKVISGNWEVRWGGLINRGSSGQNWCRVRTTRDFADYVFDFNIFRKRGGWVGVSLRHPKLRLIISENRLRLLPLEDSQGQPLHLGKNDPEPASPH